MYIRKWFKQNTFDDSNFHNLRKTPHFEFRNPFGYTTPYFIVSLWFRTTQQSYASGEKAILSNLKENGMIWFNSCTISLSQPDTLQHEKNVILYHITTCVCIV